LGGGTDKVGSIGPQKEENSRIKKRGGLRSHTVSVSPKMKKGMANRATHLYLSGRRVRTG